MNGENNTPTATAKRVYGGSSETKNNNAFLLGFACGMFLMASDEQQNEQQNDVAVARFE